MRCPGTRAVKAQCAMHRQARSAGHPLTPSPLMNWEAALSALDQRALGAVLALLAYLLLAAQDATVKWLVVAPPVCQVLFIRSEIVVLGCLAAGAARLSGTLFHSHYSADGLSRCGDAGCLVLLLHREPGLAAWPTHRAVFYGPGGRHCAGSTLAGRTGGARALDRRRGWFHGRAAGCQPNSPVPVLAHCMGADHRCLVGFWRYSDTSHHRREQSLVQMFFNNSFFLVVTGIACAAAWRSSSVTEAALLLQVAFLGGLGQFSLFEAARRMPASLIAPLEYSALVWAFVLGFLLWGDVPQLEVVLGAGLILAARAGLLLAERRRQRPVSTTE